MPVDRPNRDGGEHQEAERPQGLALAAKPLLGAGPSLRLARTLWCVHGETIERRLARANGRDEFVAPACRRHAATRRRPRTWTIAIRAPTSIRAIRTSATGQAAAPI